MHLNSTSSGRHGSNNVSSSKAAGTSMSNSAGGAAAGVAGDNWHSDKEKLLPRQYREMHDLAAQVLQNGLPEQAMSRHLSLSYAPVRLLHVRVDREKMLVKFALQAGHRLALEQLEMNDTDTWWKPLRKTDGKRTRKGGQQVWLEARSLFETSQHRSWDGQMFRQALFLRCRPQGFKEAPYLLLCLTDVRVTARMLREPCYLALQAEDATGRPLPQLETLYDKYNNREAVQGQQRVQAERRSALNLVGFWE